MHRPCLFLSLLFLSVGAHAGCQVTPSGARTISLLVDGGACFGKAEQRAAFAAELKSAVQAMEKPSGRGLQAKSTADQLNGFGDLKRQAQHLSPAAPVYYGQR